MRARLSFSLVLLLALALPALAADYPAPVEGTLTLSDFRFSSGETLPELRLHFTDDWHAAARPGRRDRQRRAHAARHRPARGAQFIAPEFAGELFGPGQLLDAATYYIILPDGIGHGQSSKPSDGLRAKFPRYGYRDMVEAQYRLLTEGLGVNHLRLVMGTSMGGMHTWLWGETLSRLHGRADAAGQPADADLRPQPGVAAHGDRRHPQRSRAGRAATTRRSRAACGRRRRCCS